ncbi:virginiamycin B lyase [Actinoplanes lutulentus]|uniref:Virginiamycin B lyase n=1 Tax=Actinoplanes lutulentus TaxID=1287878 RepID=A0A327ZL58_9ACTN|nr:hydrolase [Actinoplanes lutulentus]MBB2941114.1 virginiamycin B lyase [Actinoplanes lutulentus]RAK43423.1 virginiamycin B lyase [Actinoplanes lutulentus]
MTTELTLPEGWSPYAVAGDSTGTLWLTILAPPGLAHLTPGEPGDPWIEPLPQGQPMLLSIAGDVVWFTRTDDKLVRREAGGEQTVFKVPEGTGPYGIAATATGDVWFTAPGTNQLGRRAADGTITMFDLPMPEARPAMITCDAEGTPWAALNGAGALARVRDETVEIIKLPDGRTPPAPVGIIASAGGIWYTDIAGGSVGRVEQSGAVRQYPFADPACRPHAVAAASDGSCWASLWGSDQLAHVTTDGRITLHELPGREPHGLWVSPAEVWVAMESGSLVAVEATSGNAGDPSRP